MRLISELTMPNVGSWDGKWTGAKNRYTKVFERSKNKDNEHFIKNYFYDFGDGWSVNIKIRRALPKEKVSNNLCGYDWMIEQIRAYGRILTRSERHTIEEFRNQFVEPPESLDADIVQMVNDNFWDLLA